MYTSYLPLEKSLRFVDFHFKMKVCVCRRIKTQGINNFIGPCLSLYVRVLCGGSVCVWGGGGGMSEYQMRVLKYIREHQMHFNVINTTTKTLRDFTFISQV